MRKVYVSVLLILISLFLSSCTNRNHLLILNWGEYISDEAVELFEETYNVQVTVSPADSNELFYSKLKSGTTAYDLILPSDYMIEKMLNHNLLQKIDFEKLENFDENMYPSDLEQIISTMDPNTYDYFVPYFWGASGLMYNKLVPGLEDAVLTYGWKAYLEPEFRPKGTRIGMYDTPQYAFSTAMFYHGLDPNDPSDENIEIAYNTLRKADIQMWGDDQLKKAIAANNLDLAFVWTGDFIDMLFIDLDDGIPREEITYDFYIPNYTMAFVDAFVIPYNARHVDLAHLFIDFFLDPEIAYMNAEEVGYATPLEETFMEITNFEIDEFDYDEDDEWLLDLKEAYLKYYIYEENMNAVVLKSIEQQVVSKLSLMVNNVKTKK